MSAPIDAKIPVSGLHDLFDYDPETGILTYKSGILPRYTWNRCRAGKRAGFVHSDGYRVVRINQCHQLREHRVIWAFVYGTWPKDLIDHINGNKLDNRLSNLREITNEENLFNYRSRGKFGLSHTTQQES
jgi:hypothetical protein